MPTTGIVTSGGSGWPSCAVSPSVPATTPSLPGVPELKMIAPAAPAAWALVAFRANGQLPRCIRAIASAGKPAKSAAWQPDVETRCAGFGLRVRSTGTIVRTPVSPLAEYDIVMNSSCV